MAQDFTNLLKTFTASSVAKRPSSTAPAAHPKRKIELSGTAVFHKRPEKQPSVPKAQAKKQKKPRTVTAAATEAFQKPAEVDLNALWEEGNQAVKKRKRTVRKAKMEKVDPLYTPTKALRQAEEQEFIFGTASQLVQEEEAPVLRGIIAAMDDSEPRVAMREVGKLWGRAARDHDGQVLEYDALEREVCVGLRKRFRREASPQEGREGSSDSSLWGSPAGEKSPSLPGRGVETESLTIEHPRLELVQIISSSNDHILDLCSLEGKSDPAEKREVDSPEINSTCRRSVDEYVDIDTIVIPVKRVSPRPPAEEKAISIPDSDEDDDEYIDIDTLPSPPPKCVTAPAVGKDSQEALHDIDPLSRLIAIPEKVRNEKRTLTPPRSTSRPPQPIPPPARGKTKQTKAGKAGEKEHSIRPPPSKGVARKPTEKNPSAASKQSPSLTENVSIEPSETTPEPAAKENPLRDLHSLIKSSEWYDRFLCLEPIPIEEFTVFVNLHLRPEKGKRKMKEADVQRWCEERGVCCC